jgi:AhpD family alkylhydroperoxidase
MLTAAYPKRFLSYGVYDMPPRANYQKCAPEVFKSMVALHTATRKSSLPVELLDLVDYRVSQINGCAFCLDMHSKDLRARGEAEQRLYVVSAWRDAPNLYTSRERAALAWAEAVTRLVDQQVADEAYEQARAEFSEAELAQLTLAVVSINGWNRLNIAFHIPAGSYKSNVK